MTKVDEPLLLDLERSLLLPLLLPMDIAVLFAIIAIGHKITQGKKYVAEWVLPNRTCARPFVLLSKIGLLLVLTHEKQLSDIVSDSNFP